MVSFADHESVVEVRENGSKTLLSINNFANRSFGRGIDLLPDEDLGDWFASHDGIHQVRSRAVTPHAAPLKLRAQLELVVHLPLKEVVDAISPRVEVLHHG